MPELSRTEIGERLQRLAEDLERFPPGVTCPWPLGRVFNELVKLVKRDLSDDPVMRTIRLIEEGSGELDAGGSNVAVGTVRALIGQVLVAYEHQEQDGALAADRARATPKRAAKPRPSRAA